MLVQLGVAFTPELSPVMLSSSNVLSSEPPFLNFTGVHVTVIKSENKNNINDYILILALLHCAKVEMHCRIRFIKFGRIDA